MDLSHSKFKNFSGACSTFGQWSQYYCFLHRLSGCERPFLNKSIRNLPWGVNRTSGGLRHIFFQRMIMILNIRFLLQAAMDIYDLNGMKIPRRLMLVDPQFSNQSLTTNVFYFIKGSVKMIVGIQYLFGQQPFKAPPSNT
jgi:hypothetical protein